tara:strand:+ start:63 stop:251 length:189 start_codon:yes stop_codon:yes gene_type:complete
MNETMTNPIDGICAIITQVKQGYAVCLIDSDSENIVGTRICKTIEQARTMATSFITGIIEND